MKYTDISDWHIIYYRIQMYAFTFPFNTLYIVRCSNNMIWYNCFVNINRYFYFFHYLFIIFYFTLSLFSFSSLFPLLFSFLSTLSMIELSETSVLFKGGLIYFFKNSNLFKALLEYKNFEFILLYENKLNSN